MNKEIRKSMGIQVKSESSSGSTRLMAEAQGTRSKSIVSLVSTYAILTPPGDTTRARRRRSKVKVPPPRSTFGWPSPFLLKIAPPYKGHALKVASGCH